MISGVLLYAEPPVSADLWVLIALIYVLGAARDRLGDVTSDVRERLSPPGPSAIEQLQEEYERGDLTLQEFEQRAELALDDRAAVVVDRLEAVDGVGPDRAAAVADEFGNIEAVRRADIDDLADVHGVGPATAEKIVEEL